MIPSEFNYRRKCSFTVNDTVYNGEMVRLNKGEYYPTDEFVTVTIEVDLDGNHYRLPLEKVAVK